jgi:hypothetical protein
MNKQILTTTFVIFLSLSTMIACKNDDDANPAPAEKKCKITFFESEGDTTDILTYDVQDRLIKSETLKDGKIRYYSTYTYSPNLITETFYFEGKSTETVNHLNPNGTVNYSTTVTPEQADTTFYIYDSEGHNTLVKFKYTSFSEGKTFTSTASQVYKYNNGNIVSTIFTDTDQSIAESFYELSIIEDKQNLFSNGRTLIPGLYGKGSKLLISKETGEDYVDVISYDVNQDGLVTRRKLEHTNLIDSDQNQIYDFKINYECN